MAPAPPAKGSGDEVAVDVGLGPMGPKPDNITPPSPAPPAVVVGLRAIVLVPMTRPEGPSDTGVPEMVIPGPPSEMGVPAIEKPVGLAVKVTPAIVKIDWVGVRAIVLLPMTRPEGPSDIGVAEMVIPGPPFEMDVPAMKKPVGLAVKVVPAMVNTN